MSEHRTVVLLNTETLEEVSIPAKVHDIKSKHLVNTAPEDVDAATIEAAADKAREEYEAEHGGHYLVTNILRGDDE